MGFDSTAVMSSGATLYAPSEDDESYSYTAATNSTRRSATHPEQHAAAPARPAPRAAELSVAAGTAATILKSLTTLHTGTLQA